MTIQLTDSAIALLERKYPGRNWHHLASKDYQAARREELAVLSAKAERFLKIIGRWDDDKALPVGSTFYRGGDGMSNPFARLQRDYQGIMDHSNHR